MRGKVLPVWQPVRPPRETSYVDLYIRLDASGGVKHLYAANPENPLSDSAVAAVRRAEPFGDVPPEAICITEERFRARFRLEVK